MTFTLAPSAAEKNLFGLEHEYSILEGISLILPKKSSKGSVTVVCIVLCSDFEIVLEAIAVPSRVLVATFRTALLTGADVATVRTAFVTVLVVSLTADTVDT